MRNVRRHVLFEVARGRLVRHVSRADGRGYTHHSSLATLKEVTWFVEARGEAGVTTNELWKDLPHLAATQISVALEFLKDRGCVVTRGRRNYPASDFVFEDAMVEYHALVEDATAD